MVQVIGFKQTFDMLPVKGDPEVDTCDEKGYKLNSFGKRIIERQIEDWVIMSPKLQEGYLKVVERVRHLKPKELSSNYNTADADEKAAFLQQKWDFIEPHYTAWKNGQKSPTNGIPLEVFPAVGADAAEYLAKYSVRTIEDLAGLNDRDLERVGLPGLRDLKYKAAQYLEAKPAADMLEEKQKLNERLTALEEIIKRQEEELTKVNQSKAKK